MTLVVVTRSAVLAASVPPFLFDEIASTGHPVATELRKASYRSVQAVWALLNQPLGSDARQGLPAECDHKWFSRTFCGGRDLGALQGEEDKALIWPYISAVGIEETLAILASHPKTLDTFFEVRP